MDGQLHERRTENRSRRQQAVYSKWHCIRQDSCCCCFLYLNSLKSKRTELSSDKGQTLTSYWMASGTLELYWTSFADAELKCPDAGRVGNNMGLFIEFARNCDVSSSATLGQDEIDNIRLEVSITKLQDHTSKMCAQCECKPGCVRIKTGPLPAGTYHVSTTVGSRPLQGSPRELEQ